MQIPLSSFEQHIPETILSRGLSYWKKGKVIDIEWTDKNEVEAIVTGSEDYEVTLTIKKSNFTDCSCTCPYDYGAVCKHVVAVLFELNKGDVELNDLLTNKKSTGDPKQKKKSLKRRFKDILSKLSHEELKEYILSLAEEDRDFRNHFLTHFSDEENGLTKEEFASQIRAILRAVAGRSGFIDYSSSYAVANPVYKLLENASTTPVSPPISFRKGGEFEKSSNYISAFYLAQAVAEEMAEALRYADDSNGDISGCVSHAMELIREISDKNTEEEFRRETFIYCIGAAKNDLFTGMDWEWDFISIAAELILTGDEEKEIYLALSKMGERSSFATSTSTRIRHSILEKRHPEQAKAFIEENRNVPEMRKTLLQEAFKKKDYSRVKSLANEGIEHDKQYAGLVHDWMEWLLNTSVAEKNSKETTRLSRALFLKGHREMKYYDIMKKFTPQTEWKEFLGGIIKDLTKDVRWFPANTLASIYVKEKQWENLLNVVKQHPSFDFIGEYENFLKEKFPVELSTLYRDSILIFLERNVNRSAYETACRALRRMKKSGFISEAQKLISELRELYKKRPALMSELNTITN